MYFYTLTLPPQADEEPSLFKGFRLCKAGGKNNRHYYIDDPKLGSIKISPQNIGMIHSVGGVHIVEAGFLNAPKSEIYPDRSFSGGAVCLLQSGLGSKYISTTCKSGKPLLWNGTKEHMSYMFLLGNKEEIMVEWNGKKMLVFNSSGNLYLETKPSALSMSQHVENVTGTNKTARKPKRELVEAS